MESPVPPCGRGVYHKVAAPYFFIIMYIGQLYKEDWGFLHMLACRAGVLPSTERIVMEIFTETQIGGYQPLDQPGRKCIRLICVRKRNTETKLY